MNLAHYQCLAPFNECYNYRFSKHLSVHESSETCCFLFHGFPAERGWKNKDLAQLINDQFAYDCYVIHYLGLGESPGIFSFQRAVQDSLNYVNFILKQYKYRYIKVFGHSFGGFVGLNVALKFMPEQLILLSPLSFIPDSPELEKIVANSKLEKPHLFVGLTDVMVYEDLQTLRRQYSVREKNHRQKLSQISISVLQALHDSEVPESTTRSLVSFLGSQTSYEEVEADHAFLLKRDTALQWVLQKIHQFNVNRQV